MSEFKGLEPTPEQNVMEDQPFKSTFWTSNDCETKKNKHGKKRKKKLKKLAKQNRKLEKKLKKSKQSKKEYQKISESQGATLVDLEAVKADHDALSSRVQCMEQYVITSCMNQLVESDDKAERVRLAKALMGTSQRRLPR